MALIGTAVIVEGNTAPITTPSKTTTAGSLVVGAGCAYNGGSSPQVANVTSNQAGTYTKAGDVAAVSGTDRVGYGLTYNIGGTRVAGHTLSIASTPATTQSKSGSFQEFDSIAASPTVTAGTAASGTSTQTPSCQVTVPSGTATVIAQMIYFGGSTTATVTDGTEISEADENSDHQAMFVAAKFGVSGTVTITWLLAAARNWSCRAVAFEEDAGAAAGQPTMARWNGIPGMNGLTGRRGW